MIDFFIEKLKARLERWVELVATAYLGPVFDGLRERIDRLEHTTEGSNNAHANCLGEGNCYSCASHSHPCPCRRCLSRVWDGKVGSTHLCPGCRDRGCR